MNLESVEKGKASGKLLYNMWSSDQCSVTTVERQDECGGREAHMMWDI